MEADQLGFDWFVAKAFQVIFFIGGISAIVFIFGIFIFVASEGLDFLLNEFNAAEFFLSQRWMPTSINNPTFGLSLIHI